MPQVYMNIDDSKSYATRANLDKALESMPADWRCIAVCNTKGRHTAVFVASSLGGDVAGPAHAGFMVIG
jgi:hypothetical protein